MGKGLSICQIAKSNAVALSFSPTFNVMWYNWRRIDGFQCPVKIAISRRGLGKTFGKVRSSIEDFVTDGARFIYVVETGDMVRALTQNNGERFFSKLLEFYSEQDTSRKRYFYNKICSTSIEDLSDDEKKKIVKKGSAKIYGGTLRINGETAGYILDLNSFGEIKRNNFVNIKCVIVDEFISERLDKTTLSSPKKISSIIQSVARLKDVKIYMLANAIRKDDPILARMGFKLDKYGIYKKYDECGLLAVLDFVDPKDYPEFKKAHDKSVAGRFAKMLGETNEEENKFLSDLPDARRLTRIDYKKNGFAINIVKDEEIVTLKELKDGNIACVPFSGMNCKTLFCLTEKEQGYRMGYHVMCNSELRKMIANMLRADIVRYYSEIEYAKLKYILKGD